MVILVGIVKGLFLSAECNMSKFDLVLYVNSIILRFNLQAPCVLCIGQAFRYSPENALCIFNQQIYFIT